MKSGLGWGIVAYLTTLLTLVYWWNSWIDMEEAAIVSFIALVAFLHYFHYKKR